MFEKDRFVYIHQQGIDRFRDQVKSKLIEIGFDKKQIVDADPRIHGDVGDYFAQVWWPDEPTEIIIGKITKTQRMEPQTPGDGELNFINYDTVMRIELFEKE